MIEQTDTQTLKTELLKQQSSLESRIGFLRILYILTFMRLRLTKLNRKGQQGVPCLEAVCGFDLSEIFYMLNSFNHLVRKMWKIWLFYHFSLKGSWICELIKHFFKCQLDISCPCRHRWLQQRPAVSDSFSSLYSGRRAAWYCFFAASLLFFSTYYTCMSSRLRASQAKSWINRRMLLKRLWFSEKNGQTFIFHELLKCYVGIDEK